MEDVNRRERPFAEVIRSTIRPNGRPGDLFSTATAEAIRARIAAALGGPHAELILDELREQNEGDDDRTQRPSINQPYDAAPAPPVIRSVLPTLPEGLEFDLKGRMLLLRDTDGDIVLDFLSAAFPESADEVEPVSTSARNESSGSSALALPALRGMTAFAAIGDSGSGDRAQFEVAEAMLRYFVDRSRFGFVVMLGDNLYHDDYRREFAEPYKALLERGVEFYAALGNHDRRRETHFAPFHMNDRAYYAFTQGNVAFAVLDSNRPDDRAQAEWFGQAFGRAEERWRLAFFHHPLYSSGEHARQSREVIRPALEQLLIDQQVDVALGGHEHLYERVASQHGVRYFVSGGGGRTLVRVHPSPFDLAAASVHHFMVFGATRDQLFFEAVTSAGALLDCGVLQRRNGAAAPASADATEADRWLRVCIASRPAGTRD